MGQLVLKDNAASTLVTPLTATAGTGQTVTIAGNGSKFPTVTGTDWSFLTLFDGAGNIETMKVTAHAAGSTSLTVSRGASAGITGVSDGDVKAWSADSGVACRLVSQVVVDINGAATSAASDASDAASSAAAAAAVAASITDHIADTTAAHAASAISYAGASGLSATDVEGALDELDAEVVRLAGTQTVTGNKTFSGTGTFTNTVKLEEVIEKVTREGTQIASGETLNFDVLTQAILHKYNATGPAGAWTTNVRGDGTTALNSILAAGESITITLLVKQGTTGYLPSLTIDGVAKTPLVLGGTAWTADASCTNAFTYTIIKTGDAAFDVLASKSKYA